MLGTLERGSNSEKEVMKTAGLELSILHELAEYTAGPDGRAMIPI